MSESIKAPLALPPDPEELEPIPYTLVQSKLKLDKIPIDPHKMTRKRVEQAMMSAFELMGGVSRLVEWAQESDDNYGQFLKLYAKILPQSAPEAPPAPQIPALTINVGNVEYPEANIYEQE